MALLCETYTLRDKTYTLRGKSIKLWGKNTKLRGKSTKLRLKSIKLQGKSTKLWGKSIKLSLKVYVLSRKVYVLDFEVCFSCFYAYGATFFSPCWSPHSPLLCVLHQQQTIGVLFALHLNKCSVLASLVVSEEEYHQ